MRSIRKEELEKLVINAVMNDILTDTNIQLIAEKAFRLIEKESQDKSLLKKLEDDYRTVSKKIKKFLSTIEDGYYNPAMMERLSELEREQAALENKVVSEKLKTTEFTQEHIDFGLYSFNSGRVQGLDQTKAIIDNLNKGNHRQFDKFNIRLRRRKKRRTKNSRRLEFKKLLNNHIEEFGYVQNGGA